MGCLGDIRNRLRKKPIKPHVVVNRRHLAVGDNPLRIGEFVIHRRSFYRPWIATEVPNDIFKQKSGQVFNFADQ